MKIKVLPILLLLPFFAFSQTAEEKRKIASYSNQEANTVLAKELQKEEQERKLRLDAYLKSNPHVSKVEISDDGFGIKELMDVLPSGEKIYAKTHNAGAATTARATALYNGGSLGINIQGQGMTAGIWDGGTVRGTHQEFMVGGVSKVTNMNTSTLSNHATHVAGTIGAQGVQASARGLAFDTNILAYDWTNDLTEMLSEASNGLLVSNHSYGIGQLNQLWFYGAYDSRAQQIDNICYNNQYYLPVVSAGNDRNENTPPASTQIAAKQGYDLIFGHGNAKNVLTVAAINEMTNYIGLASPQMSQFSSYGPSDDGRVKPEISMKGVNVNSTTFSSNTSYGPMSGTSMASPGITGVITLLQQYYNQLYSNYMKASTVKGLILHTADDAGTTLGPDARFGWGVVNATTAAKVIRDKNLQLNGSVIEENVLNNSDTYSKMFSASGPGQLRVSISWTDPASPTFNNGITDPTTIHLVNDLDISVTSVATGTIHYPWKLQGMATPNAAATRNSTNDVDNFERIDIDNPSGEYILNVSHKGNLAVPQNYSIVITAGNLNTLNASEVESKPLVNIFPNPTTDILNILGLEKFTAIILDESGRMVLNQQSDNGKINVSSLSVGSYYLVIKNHKGKDITLKFLKK